jgi:vitamin K-dependent gamma-carboxylase
MATSTLFRWRKLTAWSGTGTGWVTASQRLLRRLDAPVDAASLALFRIGFGLVMAFAMGRFLAKGWVDELFLQPAFHFTYPGFSWIRPLPPVAMHGCMIALLVLALCVAAGWRYRLAMGGFFLGFTYVELIDQTAYLNHYYLVSLISGLLIFLPANRLWSLDHRRAPNELAMVPAWTVWLLRFQFGLVYVFAGLAKLNADWLWEAQPLRTWLAARSDLPVVGAWLDEPWVAYAASWAGAIYDLGIVFLLLGRRTRPWATGAIVVFHLGTWLLFRIGMFPWIMMVGALLFMPPDWPRRVIRRSVRGTIKGVASAPGLAGEPEPRSGLFKAGPGATPSWVFGLIAVYAAGQVIFPLRAGWDGTAIAWSGYRFNWSWRVMLVEKSGHVEFWARAADQGRRWKVPMTDYLTRRQAHFLAQDPQLIRDLARHIAADLQRKGHAPFGVYADAYASLNGRPHQRLIDPEVNLAGPLKDGWIVALKPD